MPQPLSPAPSVHTVISPTEEGVSSTVPVPRRLMLWLTYGVIGTLLFPIIYLVAGAVRPGYDPWQQAISTLSQGPGGWLQRANFVLCGVSVIWLALVFRKILRGGACATWYPRVRATEGVGLIMIGIFSTDPMPGYPPGTLKSFMTLQGAIHLAFTIIVVNMMALGLFVISRRFWKNPNFPGWAAFSIVSGILTFAFMTAFGIANATHSGYPGLFERLATNTDTIWGVILLIPLWAGRSFMCLDSAAKEITPGNRAPE
jgi:hypothetical membrane protein